MKPAEIAAAIRVCDRNPDATIEPAPLLKLADLVVAYLEARDRWDRTGLDAEMLGAQTVLDRADAALRTAVGAPKQQIADGHVSGVEPGELAAARRSPPAGAKERVFARISLQQRAAAAVKMASAALRSGLGYSPDRDIEHAGPYVATLAAGLLTAEASAELVAVQQQAVAQQASLIQIQQRAFADDTLRAGVSALLAGDAPADELRRELQQLLGGAR